MYYLLQIGYGTSILNAYAANASGAEVAYVKDYVKRILSKQGEDSEEEGNKW